jgi:VRR-NUC domain
MAKQSEHRLQIAVAHLLAVVLDPAQTWWSALDHGAGKMTPASAGLRKARGVQRGLPDFIILFKNELLGIELKSDKGRLSPEQVETGDRWMSLGHDIAVARSLEDVQDILDAWHIPMRVRMRIMGGSNGRAARTTQPRDRGPRRAGRAAATLPVV